MALAHKTVSYDLGDGLADKVDYFLVPHTDGAIGAHRTESGWHARIVANGASIGCCYRSRAAALRVGAAFWAALDNAQRNVIRRARSGRDLLASVPDDMRAGFYDAAYIARGAALGARR